ncbi:MAG: hypothetical protein JNK48_03930 [Bryobacterales bacterium]|nr:hypothetical protein [Bryobacterales bacterium]
MKPIRVLCGMLAPALLLADFTYTDTTRITGGVMASMSRSLGGLSKSMRKITEPQTRTHIIKGNKMADIGATDGAIYDLDAGSITTIDFEKRTYSTITFEQMRQAMDRMMAKSKGRMDESKAKGNSDVQADFKVDIKETGKTQMISGFNSKEVIMTFILEGKDKKSGQTGAMETMSSIWVAQEKIPGYEEVQEFQKKLAMKYAGAFANSSMAGLGAAMASDPRMREAMEKMAKEAEKMQGVHVRQITKMGTGLDPAKASEISDPNATPEGPTAGEVAGKAAEKTATESAEKQVLGRLGKIGGFGGFGRKKPKQEEAPPPSPQQSGQNQQGQASGLLMEMVVDSANFSNAPADGSKLVVPDGFKQVEHPMLKESR